MNDNKNKLTPNPSNKVDFIFPIELSSLSVSSYLLRFTVVEPIDSVVLSRKLIVVELLSVSFTTLRVVELAIMLISMSRRVPVNPLGFC